MIKTIIADYKEAPFALGLVGSDKLIEIWVSRKGDRTFTILLTTAKNNSCIIAFGEAWDNKITPLDDDDRL